MEERPASLLRSCHAGELPTPRPAAPAPATTQASEDRARRGRGPGAPPPCPGGVGDGVGESCKSDAARRGSTRAESSPGPCTRRSRRSSTGRSTLARSLSSGGRLGPIGGTRGLRCRCRPGRRASRAIPRVRRTPAYEAPAAIAANTGDAITTVVSTVVRSSTPTSWPTRRGFRVPNRVGLAGAELASPRLLRNGGSQT
jgi:hypothetical protein